MDLRVRSWIANLKSARELEQVRKIHAAAAVGKQDLSSIYLANTLVAAYGRLGSMVEARSLFEKMGFHRVASWNSLIHGYLHNADPSAAMDCLEAMRDGGFRPDARTFVLALKACGNGSSKGAGMAASSSSSFVELEQVMALHALAVSSGYGGDIYLLNTLVSMYGRLGSLVDARRVFETIERPDVISWNAIIQSYVDNSRGEQALELFASCLQCCSMVDSHTFVAAVKAATCLEIGERSLALEIGMALHARAEEDGCGSDVFVGSCLIDMYSGFARMVEAHLVFEKIFRKDVVSWTSLIFGYVGNGEPELALDLFQEMQRRRVLPNSQTFVAALKACISLAERSPGKVGVFLEKGMALHSQAHTQGCCSNIFVATTLVNFYAGCGTMVDAHRAFDKTEDFHRNVVLWNALLLGYVENGQPELALEWFPRMEIDLKLHMHSRPSSRSFACAFKACGSAVALSTGKSFHAKVCRLGLLDKSDSVLATSMMDFYTKCGSLFDAQHLFDTASNKSIIIWTVLMAGYSRRGDASRVLELYTKMEAEEIEPSSVTFLLVLTACNHTGRVDEAKRFLATMADKYEIDPAIEHYDCLVDALGRADRVGEALEMAGTMPVEADSVTWKTLLGACGKQKDLVVGKMAFESLLRIDQGSMVEACSVMANICSQKP